MCEREKARVCVRERARTWQDDPYQCAIYQGQIIKKQVPKSSRKASRQKVRDLGEEKRHASQPTHRVHAFNSNGTKKDPGHTRGIKTACAGERERWAGTEEKQTGRQKKLHSQQGGERADVDVCVVCHRERGTRGAQYRPGVAHVSPNHVPTPVQINTHQHTSTRHFAPYAVNVTQRHG